MFSPEAVDIYIQNIRIDENYTFPLGVLLQTILCTVMCYQSNKKGKRFYPVVTI